MDNQKPGTPVPSKSDVASDLLESAEAILGIEDTQTKDVEVPEWGGKKIRVRSMTSEERDRWETSLMKIDKKGNRQFFMQNMRARLIALCAINSKGQRLFSEEHILALGQKNASPISRIYEAAQKLSGITEADEEELVKNFSDTPPGGSATA